MNLVKNLLQVLIILPPGTTPFLYPKFCHILPILIAWIVSSCSPLPPPYHTNVPAAINSFFIISFILPAPFKQTPALQARLRPRLAFSSSFNPQTFIFSPSVTSNGSIFLPVSYFSLRLRHLLIVFQILSSHGGQKKSKTANSASNTISICPV